jgi:ubiquinone/menaquinone biosynthesis C-methylase UbiE
MLPRILEPELMDSAEDAHEYDAMDHAAVNALFVADLLQALSEGPLKRPFENAALLLNVLDLGAGTAQIPIELAHRARHGLQSVCGSTERIKVRATFPQVSIVALDAAQSMVELASHNIRVAGLANRITPLLGDAKQLPFDAGQFEVVISNSILHHIPEPRDVLCEALRVTALGGLLFHRDLCRPRNEPELNRVVDTYAADANVYQRKLFADSLHAALTLDEMQRLVAEFGFADQSVRMTSDRHWTWISAKI